MLMRTRATTHAPKSKSKYEYNVDKLSQEEQEELETDRRAIRNALRTAKAGNLGKATRILDNVYKQSPLTVEEKVSLLKSLHPSGKTPQMPMSNSLRDEI